MSDILINSRHRQLLTQARDSLMTAVSALDSGMDNEIISIDLRNATKILGELTGENGMKNSGKYFFKILYREIMFHVEHISKEIE